MSKSTVQDAPTIRTVVVNPAVVAAPKRPIKAAKIRPSEPIESPRPEILSRPEGLPRPESLSRTVGSARKTRHAQTSAPVRRFPSVLLDDDGGNRQAELFYLQKQIQLQTQMIFILEDGERLQGIIEWYDRHSIKIRGKSRVLIYKSAIKYLYKAGEMGTAPEK